MFNANFASYPYVSPVNSYTDNLGHAARSFIAALLAIDPAKYNTSTAGIRDAVHDAGDAYDEIDLLARKFDAIMPNQAAELRYLLSRN